MNFNIPIIEENLNWTISADLYGQNLLEINGTF